MDAGNRAKVSHPSPTAHPPVAQATPLPLPPSLPLPPRTPPSPALPSTPTPESNTAGSQRGLTPSWAGQNLKLFGAVVECLRQVRQRQVDPKRCASEARQVVNLWVALGKPDLDELVEDMTVLAEWARDADDHAASNDIRGVRANGERWGADRCRSVATLCSAARWQERVDLARAWATGGRPKEGVRGHHPGNEPVSLLDQDTLDELYSEFR